MKTTLGLINILVFMFLALTKKSEGGPVHSLNSTKIFGKEPEVVLNGTNIIRILKVSEKLEEDISPKAAQGATLSNKTNEIQLHQSNGKEGQFPSDIIDHREVGQSSSNITEPRMNASLANDLDFNEISNQNPEQAPLFEEYDLKRESITDHIVADTTSFFEPKNNSSIIGNIPDNNEIILKDINIKTNHGAESSKSATPEIEKSVKIEKTTTEISSEQFLLEMVNITTSNNDRDSLKNSSILNQGLKPFESQLSSERSKSLKPSENDQEKPISGANQLSQSSREITAFRKEDMPTKITQRLNKEEQIGKDLNQNITWNKTVDHLSSELSETSESFEFGGFSNFEKPIDLPNEVNTFNSDQPTTKTFKVLETSESMESSISSEEQQNTEQKSPAFKHSDLYESSTSGLSHSTEITSNKQTVTKLLRSSESSESSMSIESQENLNQESIKSSESSQSKSSESSSPNSSKATGSGQLAKKSPKSLDSSESSMSSESREPENIKQKFIGSLNPGLPNSPNASGQQVTKSSQSSESSMSSESKEQENLKQKTPESSESESSNRILKPNSTKAAGSRQLVTKSSQSLESSESSMSFESKEKENIKQKSSESLESSETKSLDSSNPNSPKEARSGQLVTKSSKSLESSDSSISSESKEVGIIKQESPDSSQSNSSELSKSSYPVGLTKSDLILTKPSQPSDSLESSMSSESKEIENIKKKSSESSKSSSSELIESTYPGLPNAVGPTTSDLTLTKASPSPDSSESSMSAESKEKKNMKQKSSESSESSESKSSESSNPGLPNSQKEAESDQLVTKSLQSSESSESSMSSESKEIENVKEKSSESSESRSLELIESSNPGLPNPAGATTSDLTLTKASQSSDSSKSPMSSSKLSESSESQSSESLSLG